MFQGEELKQHFESSSTIRSESLVVAEWNLNMPDNIFKLGNYRYRPTDTDLKYKNMLNIFDRNDIGNYYTGATDADIIVDGGVDYNNTPQLFKSTKDNLKLFYSLEDCIKPFRPRSGINKANFMSGKFIPNSNKDMFQRPRYYMPSRYDEFRYWTSYRTEDNIERGIANNISNGQFFIDDAAPFVVYKNPVPANRLVVKMQTNIGSVNLGPFSNNSGSYQDPFFGDANKTTPVRWKIQYLLDDNWVDAYSFNESSLRSNGTAVVGADGYVELQYGIVVKEELVNKFKLVDTLSSATLLPESSVDGFTYLVIENENDLGLMYTWSSDLNDFATPYPPEYGWMIVNEPASQVTNFVTDFVNPSYYNLTGTNKKFYREFQYISGIRVIVDTMNKQGSTFDLIEMSPRLTADISSMVNNYKVSKIMSDIGNTSLPVGQLLVSNGDISIFDEEQAFNKNNVNSIIHKYIDRNVKFNFYEKILNVNNLDYFVPIKTMYSDGLSQTEHSAGTVSLQLRDFYFYLESMTAPRMLVTNASLSYAICSILDYIGFTNYVFYRTENESENIIPYFFIAPDQNVAEVLNQLAIATQTAMFFDEYNNFVIMSKDYILPSINDRDTSMTLIGSDTQSKDGIIKNSSTTLSNILAISSETRDIFNDGKINYTERYIQRSEGSIKQASLVDKEKTWIYKPSLLWEVSGTEVTKTKNQIASTQGSYVLGAMPLNSDLSIQVPQVVNNALVNNIIDFGENIYWITRYSGYLYSSGEIIRYDAVQFNITGVGNVWISSNQEYQKYFSQLPFNGKIYPTGLVRIYAEPYYESSQTIRRLKNGAVVEHGRGQFGTLITNHYAGADLYWSNNDYVRGCTMQSQYLFTTQLDPVIPSTTVGQAGINNTLARQTSRNSIIKNFMSTNYISETDVNNLKSTQTGTIQSSALVMNGPSFKSTDNPIDFISYVYRDLSNGNLFTSSTGEKERKFTHFGTRMRIVGKIENNENRSQTPVGLTSYYQVPGNSPTQSISIGGGSGGIGVMVDPSTNNGYYFEIIALTEDNIESYLNFNAKRESAISINNIVFYKVMKDSSSSNAIPVKLWGGLSKIIVDDGKFTGQYRIVGEENPTVYDLSVEYQDIGTTRRFYLYINNKLIATVDDKNPLPVTNNVALFTRGSSRCMFENVYGLSQNYSQSTSFSVAEPMSKIFGDSQIDANEAFRKYALSGLIQSTYMSGISAQNTPKYDLYFEEFGTIMRECSYFDIKYDRAYPALYAQISPTFNRIKGYTVSGFYADSYGAEFLIFNATDKALSLDETTGNYLRIQGITFTQDTTHQLSVDEYFKKRANFADPELSGDSVIYPSTTLKIQHDEIKQSRMIYGKKEFSIDSPYIQSQDDAEQLMGWIINKVMKPKRSIGIEIFPIPTLQLGDIVEIDYTDNDVDIISVRGTRFVVYNIEYSRGIDGPSMTIYLSEV